MSSNMVSSNIVSGRLVVGLSVGIAVGLSIGMIGSALVQRSQNAFPQQLLHAGAANATDTFAMATGAIDDEVDGVFMLDFLTGELQGSVLNHRTGKFSGVFKTNVVATLGGTEQGKSPKYLLMTGNINFPRGGAMARPARSVVYVLDTNTGNFAAYGMPWRREMASTGRPQAAPMSLLDRGRMERPIRGE